MSNTQRKHRDPLLHIAKRDNMPGWKAWLIRIAAILVGFLICGILSSLLTEATVGESYQIMFKGVSSSRAKPPFCGASFSRQPSCCAYPWL